MMLQQAVRTGKIFFRKDDPFHPEGYVAFVPNPKHPGDDPILITVRGEVVQVSYDDIMAPNWEVSG